MRIKASTINGIFKKYGYKFVFDKLHSDTELKKYGKNEPNFDTHKYLTIKTSDNIVVGRLYTINAPESLPLSKIFLEREEIDKIIAFFKFFKLKNYKKIIDEINKITDINPANIQADIIRNNVYQGKRSQY